jgi:hypothetical protein
VSRESCLFDGCDRWARPGFALCRGHEKQKERGQHLRPLRHYDSDPWERLVDAARRFLNAESKADKAGEKRAKELARVHATNWIGRKRR